MHKVQGKSPGEIKTILGGEKVTHVHVVGKNAFMLSRRVHFEKQLAALQNRIRKLELAMTANKKFQGAKESKDNRTKKKKEKTKRNTGSTKEPDEEDTQMDEGSVVSESLETQSTIDTTIGTPTIALLEDVEMDDCNLQLGLTSADAEDGSIHLEAVTMVEERDHTTSAELLGTSAGEEDQDQESENETITPPLNEEDEINSDADWESGLEEPNYGISFSPMKRRNKGTTAQPKYSSIWQRKRMENQPSAGDEPSLECPQNDTPIKDSGKRGAKSPLDCQVRKKRLPEAQGRLGSIKANSSFQLNLTTRVDAESENETMPTQ